MNYPLWLRSLCKNYDAVILLGCIIKGETPHFEIISQSISDKVLETSLNKNVPIIFGVLTTNNESEAKERAAYKGSEFAMSALKYFRHAKQNKVRVSPSPTKTRELVIQALYQKTISGDSNTKVLKELKQTQKKINTDKVAEIVKDIKSLEQKFIEIISKFSNIPTSRIGEIELSILYLALYEISHLN